jgi:hypothetical protein
MTTANTEEQIRRIYQAWHDATKVQDLGRLGALYADDAIAETAAVLGVWQPHRQNPRRNRALGASRQRSGGNGVLPVEASVMFADCPAHMDNSGPVRCGLPVEVEGRYTMRSADGPLESARIRCLRGHWFNSPVESLTLSRQSHGRDDAGGRQRGGHPSAVAERAGGRAAVAGAGVGHGHEDGRAEGRAGLPDHVDHGGPSGER